MDGYFETNEAEDVLGSLRHLQLCLGQAAHDPQAWKWVVLSLFSAVQGSIVCHAAGTSKVQCLTDDSATKVLAWLEKRSGPMPEEKLAGPGTLFNRMNGTYSKFPPYGGVITTSPECEQAFQRLKHLRDDLSHFSPKGWWIEKDFVKETIPPMLDLIDQIDARSWAFRHLEPHGSVSHLVQTIRTGL